MWLCGAWATVGTLVSLQIGTTTAYPAGGPISGCADPYPHHEGTSAQTSRSPFELVLSKSSYSEGDNITITAQLKSGVSAFVTSFTGIQIAAHTTNGRWDNLPGQFISSSPGTALLAYFSSQANCLSHKNSQQKTSVVMVWQAPPASVGDILFSATILVDFETYWTNVSALLTSDIGNRTLSIPQQVVSPAASYSIDGCGSTKSCLLWPRTCSSPQDCDVAVAYSIVSPNRVLFQMSGKTPGYLSLGISKDKKMADDETLTCLVLASGRLSFQHGYNPGYYNSRVIQDSVTNISMRYENGRLYCEFIRPTFAYIVVTLNGQTRMYPFDIAKPGVYYAYMGWGNIYPGSYDTMMIHDVLPVVSPMQMNMSKLDIQYFNSLPIEIQMHVTLMLIAWLGFASISIVVARYFRTSLLNSKKLDRKPAWLQVHRGLTFAAAPFTLAGFVLIFVYIYGWSKVASMHSGFGVAVTVLMVVQSIAGLGRPHPTSSRRRAFAWFHRLTGGLTWVCAATCLMLGVNIAYLPPRMAVWGTAVVAVWIVCQILFMVILESLKCCSDQLSGSADIAMGNVSIDEKEATVEDIVNSTRTSTVSSINTHKSVVFVLYLIFMTALLAAGLGFTWAY